MWIGESERHYKWDAYFENEKKLTYWVVYALNKLVYLWTLTAVKFVLKWHGLVLKKKYASKGNDIN